MASLSPLTKDYFKTIRPNVSRTTSLAMAMVRTFGFAIGADTFKYIMKCTTNQSESLVIFTLDISLFQSVQLLINPIPFLMLTDT